MQPAQTVLSYGLADGTTYIDLAEGLSKVNRRAYRQGMEYAIGKITFAYAADPTAVLGVQLFAQTAGDTWTVHNAWKKGFSVWIKQQRNARRLIGQSAKPTWEDFKVYLDDDHRAGTISQVIAGDGAYVDSGEWDYSRLIHEADDASVDERYMHLIGGDVSTTDWGLILGYQQSRATVQAEDPDLPDQFSTNMYALMAQDVDAVADEVAQNMESQNDEPPYDQDDYPGSDTNSDACWVQEIGMASSFNPIGVVPGFVAQCGLLKFDLSATSAQNGVDVPAPTSLIQVHLVPGPYKGIAAFPMGQ